MRRLIAVLAISIGVLSPAVADELRPLTTAAEIFGLEAVGRVDYSSANDRGFCTGTLVARALVLTAAHCVVNSDGVPRDADELTFRAGLRLGRAKGERRVSRIAVHPRYIHGPGPTPESVSVDLALIELDRPIDYWSITPLEVTETLGRGQSVQVVSYAQGRDETSSREADCSVLGRKGRLMALDCQATFGASGSPVFVATSAGLRIVSVVSAIGTYGTARATYAVAISDAMPILKAAFPSAAVPVARLPAPGHRTLRAGDRSGTGGSIRFLRPGE